MEMSEDSHFRDCTTDDGIVDLSRKGLVTCPKETFINGQAIKFCYLDGNQLTKLPSTFFTDLPQLQWLDLRNNFIENLPTTGLAGHVALQVLLLQSNRIKKIPTDLAQIPNLKGLQLSNNPIENIPFHVIASGFQSVINFLRESEERPDFPALPATETITTKQKKHQKKIKSVDKARRRSHDSRCALSCPSQTSSVSGIVTEAQIEAREKEDIEKAMLRETLERQSKMLQRIKDAEAVKTWRKIIRRESQKKFLDNFQYSPSRNFLEKSPFDVDLDMLQMLNRADLYKSLKESNRPLRKSQTRSKTVEESVRDIQLQIESIKTRLDAINFEPKILNKEDKKYHLTTRIDEINKLRNHLHKLCRENLH